MAVFLWCGNIAIGFAVTRSLSKNSLSEPGGLFKKLQCNDRSSLHLCFPDIRLAGIGFGQHEFMGADSLELKARQ